LFVKGKSRTMKRGDKDKGGGEMWEAGDKSRHPNKYTVIDNLSNILTT